ncbi:toll/interleukin-1 receptor domain-containing adapter protein isoform X2 [Nycticebus coucang]|uniref:toll/interleukin-1 receptor domain-containing adapter protein isoform X2 n=1 Tax=Nycticebus coucang TaxID=9470 RepID=UPI00234CDAC1|nr:toll/interleukin-1 receptor domain-containing adapter protein isoform X2 [Nycticebus coucang]
MASSTSLPAPRSRSRKPLSKMSDWLRQALSRKPERTSDSAESSPGALSWPASSQDGPPAVGVRSPGSPSPPSTSPAVGVSSVRSPGAPSPPSTSPTPTDGSSGRWGRDYDVCVCHSEEDLGAAQALVSHLEGGAAGLRCFLQLRDAAPGGAIASELCQALSRSHCRVLLITPGFLRDPWCRYQMLQALAEAPGAEGRTIPLLSGLARSAYPPELRFMYYVDGRGPDGGFHQVQQAVLRCKLYCKARWAGEEEGSSIACVPSVLLLGDTQTVGKTGSTCVLAPSPTANLKTLP